MAAWQRKSLKFTCDEVLLLGKRRQYIHSRLCVFLESTPVCSNIGLAYTLPSNLFSSFGDHNQYIYLLNNVYI